MSPEVIVLMSGGLDSLVCASILEEQGCQTTALFVDYGQCARVAEHAAVKTLTESLDITLEIATIHVSETFGQGLIVGRNTLLISLALMISQSRFSGVAIGVHAGTRYYDCSPHFFERMSILVAENSNGRVELLAPLLHWPKSKVVDYALDKGLPVSKTYSCEMGSFPPCRTCQSCKDREMFIC